MGDTARWSEPSSYFKSGSVTWCCVPPPVSHGLVSNSEESLYLESSPKVGLTGLLGSGGNGGRTGAGRSSSYECALGGYPGSPVEAFW